MPTIEFADGFDGFSTIGDVYPASDSVLSGSAARFGSQGVRMVNGSQAVNGPVLASVATRWQMFAMRSTTWAVSGTPRGLAGHRDAGVVSHVDLRMDSSGHLLVTRSGTVLATSTLLWPLDSAFHWVAFGVTISDTVGTVDVKVDGVSYIAITGADTRNGTSSTINSCVLGGIANDGSHNVDYDDWIMADGEYSDRACLTLLPNGNGNSSDFTGSDGNSTDNYLLADESAPNGDTDYNQSSTAGHKDLYTMANLANATGTIDAVVGMIVARKDDAGARTFRILQRESSTEASGTTRTPTTSYVTYWDVFATKPSGGAWDATAVNALEQGMEIVS